MRKYRECDNDADYFQDCGFWVHRARLRGVFDVGALCGYRGDRFYDKAIQVKAMNMTNQQVLESARAGLCALLHCTQEVKDRKTYCMHCGFRWLGELHGHDGRKDPPKHAENCPVLVAQKSLDDVWAAQKRNVAKQNRVQKKGKQ